MAHGAHLVNLDVQGKVQPCLIKDAQYDHLGAELVHLDLARVDLNETVKVHVTLELRGTPKGAAEGGQLRQEMMELEVECLVTNIPENIRVSVADLALNQVLYVKDLTRTFVALLLPEDWMEYLAGVSRDLAARTSGLSWVKPGNFHLTIRFLGDPDNTWHPIDGASLNTRQAYRWRHPSRPELGIDLVVYDGEISHDVAFGGFPSQTVVERVQRDGTCWLSGTTWQSRAAMRVSVSNWSTTEQDGDRSVAAILEAASRP